ncbi:MAG: TIM-barrel domain-containing protein [Janthinobacterium lividum]
MPNVNRRQLAGGMAAAAAVSLLHTQAQQPADLRATPLDWTLVHPGVWRATVGTPEVHTPVRDRLIPPAQGLAGLPAPPQPTLEGASATVGARGAFVSLPLAEGELMYGFGLQLKSFQQRGKKRTIRVNADPTGDSGDSHAPVPFYVTSHGYGILVDTFRQAQIYCGDAHPKPTKPAGSGPVTVNTPAEMRETDRHGNARVQIEVPRCNGVDIYLFAGPTMMAAVERYNLFSGGGVAPPEWGLGFWYRPEMHLSADQVLAMAEQFRSRKIPCDVLGLEPGWQTHAYSCSFAWERTRFPDPAAFIAEAGKRGFRINLWEHAFTHPSSPMFADMVPHSGSNAVWQGLVPDFAAPAARKVFADYHGRVLIDAGVSGFKLDECDNSDYTQGWSWPDFATFPSGLDGEQMHGAFGLRYQHAVLQAFQSRNKQTYSLVRSSGALASPYPFVLYSDLYDHRDFIRGLVNAGFSGLLWCPEVRDATSEEDLLRRLQSVVFSPVAMVNAWYIKNPPWQQIDRDRNNKGELAPGWETLEAKCRHIVEQRMSMVPYLRAAFARYAAQGTPVFRSPVLDFPQDPALANIDDQYLVGDRLLVAPLFAGEAGRTVTLPTGTDWHDFWTGARHPGGTKLQIAASHVDIPVFIRANSVLPWAEPGMHSASPETRRLRVRVYGDGSDAWQGAGEDLQGVSLAWSKAGGAFTPARNAQRAYQVVGWDRIS